MVDVWDMTLVEKLKSLSDKSISNRMNKNIYSMLSTLYFIFNNIVNL